MRIVKEHVSALMIDIQEKLFPHMAEKEFVVEHMQKLIEGLKALEIPITITEQYRKGLGETISPLMNQFENFKYHEKKSFSCCDDTNLMSEVTKLGKPIVIVFGIETHVCVMQTVIDLKEKGFTPVVIEDCTSSRNLNNKAIAIERMRQEGAIVSTMESILFELCRVSGSDLFKAISKIVK